MECMIYPKSDGCFDLILGEDLDALDKGFAPQIVDKSSVQVYSW